VPKDQVATAYDRSKAEDATKVMHTENATPLTQPADVKGTIVRQTAQPTAAGNERTVEETIVPKDQVEASYEENAFDHVSIVRHTENPNALTNPIGEVGKIKENQNLPMPAGNARTEERVRTAIPQTTNFTSFISDDSSGAIEKGHNAAAMPVITEVADADVFLDGDINPFQKFDYVKRTITATVPKSCPSAITWDVLGDEYWRPSSTYPVSPQDVYDAGYVSKLEQLQKVETHTISFHLTAAAAALALASGRNGSHPVKVGNHLWMAHKATFVINVLQTITFSKPEQDHTGVQVVYKAE
jgi:hypothetical protein